MFTPLPKGKDCLSTADDDHHEICSIPWKIKVFSVFLIQLPHAILILFLTWTGAYFLQTTSRMLTLIFKAVGLQYILQIDTLVFKTLETNQFQREVMKTSYQFEHVYNIFNSWHFRAWGLNLLKILTVFGATHFIQYQAFGYLAHFRTLCYDYLDHYP